MRITPFALLLALACNGTDADDDKSADDSVDDTFGDADTDSDTDADADADTDADSDADSDADTDADADADSDADADTGQTGDTGRPAGLVEETAVGALPIVVVGSTPGQGNDGQASCGGQPAPDVLVGFTAPSDGRYSFLLAGSDYDSVVYVLDGVTGAELGCSDVHGYAEAEFVLVDLTAGQLVVVGVDGHLGDSGDFTLTIGDVPSNELACTDGGDDDFDGALDCLDGDCQADAGCAVTCPEKTYLGNPRVTSGSTLGKADDSAGSCGGAGASDVTASFTAPFAGRYRFDDAGTAFQGVLYVTAGCGGAELACSSEAGDGNNEIVLDLANGQVVTAVIDGATATESGAFALTAVNVPSAESSCTDGVDEDYDDVVDCFDVADCATDPACLEICTNNVDDDLDGAVDCDDASCATAANCVPEPDCTNAVDDDLDQLVDCADPDCAAALNCYESSCTDGVDQDGDGAIDCDDRDCVRDPSCGSPASCREWHLDDPALPSGVYTIEPTPGVPVDVWCDMTTDGGGWTLVGSTRNTTFDDAGTALWYSDLTSVFPASGHSEIWQGMRPTVSPGTGRSDIRFACKVNAGNASFDVDLSFYDIGWYNEITTGTDAQSCFNEGDGAGDDPPPARRNNRTGAFLAAGDPWNYGYLEGEDTCSDTSDFTLDFDDRGMDSVQDATDWGEDDGVMECGTTTGQSWFVFMRERDFETSCADGLDDDADGAADCADSDCAADQACIESDCADGFDDDGDGAVDCDDADCGGDPVCPCYDFVLSNVLPAAAFGNTTGATNDFTPSCTSSTAPDHAFSFTAPAAGLYTFDTNGSAFDTALMVYDGCGGVELACDDDGGVGTQSLTSVNLAAGQTVIVVVDAYSSNSGAYTLNAY